MKRRELIRYLLKHGCVPEREGSKHVEINTFTGRGVCRDLGIPVINIR